MAKQSGLGDALYLGGNDVSGDTQQINSIHGGPAVLDVTSIDRSAYERIGGQRTGEIDVSTFFNPTRAHPILAALPTTDVILTYCRGTALGSPAACMVSLQTNYDGTRDTSGMFTFKVAAQADAYGLEWGLQGTAGWRTDASATNGTGVDLGSTWSASFGLQAYLQVAALTSGTPTVKLQGSPDNVTFTDIVGGGFATPTALSAQRIATASNLAVARYFRVVTTGTFAGLVFSVVVVPNPVAVSF